MVILFVFVCVVSYSQILSINTSTATLNEIFPNATLRAIITEKLGTTANLSGKNLINALNTITELEINGFSNRIRINNMQGIEYLTRLTKLSLSGIDIDLTNLNLAPLTKLTYLNLVRTQFDNFNFSLPPNLTYLNLEGWGVNVDNINIHSLTELTHLGINSWSSDLSNLNLSSLPKLTSLSLGGQKFNIHNISSLTQLTKLNLDNTSELNQLNLAALTNLTHLSLNGWNDVRNYEVQNFELDENGEVLFAFPETKVANTPLDVSKNTNLTHLSLGGEIWRLDISNLPNLISLSVHSGGGDGSGGSSDEGAKLEAIDLTNNPQLQHLHLSGFSAGSLDISQNRQLVTFSLSRNYSIRTINLGNLPFLTSISLSRTHVISINVRNSPKLERISTNLSPLTQESIMGLLPNTVVSLDII